MKACIIGIQNIKHMTLISIYTEYFRKNDIEYDIVYIDKYGIDESVGAECEYKFDGSVDKYNGFIGKILKSIEFKKYAEHILKRNKYDFVVVWREQTAFLFSRFLKKYYKNKYSVNIRDLWDSKNIFLTNGVKKAVNNSAYNTVSSEGFIKYLPSADYTMVHSANREIIEKGFKPGNKDELPIRITYIGTLRFQEYCIELIKSFDNDSCFLLEFIGQGSEEIEAFCKANHYTNVYCSGSFAPQETNEKLQGTHVINCAFGSVELAERMLTPIRLYYAVSAGIPILTAEGTWIDEIGKKYGMGISVPSTFNANMKIGNSVMAQYQNKNFEEMKLLQKKLSEEVIMSYNQFCKCMDSALNIKRSAMKNQV